jgi:hypothetical protein
MSAGVVSSAKGTCVRDMIRKEVTKLEFAVRGRVSLVSTSVQAVDSTNAGDISICMAVSIWDHLTRRQGNPLLLQP